MSESEQEAGQLSPEIAANQGDRWTFVGILPDSSFIHTLHHGARTLEQATLFVGKIKAKSDQASPLFASDDWFYEKALLEHYGMDFQPPYAGRGPYPKAIRVPLADLNYVQVQKKRDERGRLEEINYNIIYGTPQSVAQVFKQAERCKTINTVYVESRNGKFRKDDARLIRRTLCHSKKAIFGAARPDYGKI